jgi:hypothetical protein
LVGLYNIGLFAQRVTSRSGSRENLLRSTEAGFAVGGQDQLDFFAWSKAVNDKASKSDKNLKYRIKIES